MNSARMQLMALAVVGLAGFLALAADPPTVFRGVLPANWKMLGLSDEQKQQVYKVQANYRPKIEELEGQIRDLKAKEKKDLEALLTPAQKDRLREILKDKAPTDEPKPETPKTDPKP